MAKDAKTIREELARPFAPEDLEWRIQVTSKDKTSGLAIPYVTNRAIQDLSLIHISEPTRPY